MFTLSLQFILNNAGSKVTQWEFLHCAATVISIYGACSERAKRVEESGLHYRA